MQTYEFNTVIREGVIHIPEQYRNKSLLSVKVILLSNDDNLNDERNKKFTAMKLQTKNFTFNREEAHAR
jgi:hypothetical protein